MDADAGVSMAETAAMDPGFKGTLVDSHGVSNSIQIHFHFGRGDQIEGIGQDGMGQFTVAGTYSDSEATFICTYSNPSNFKRKFTGVRNKDMSISGRWSSTEGGLQSGDYKLAHELSGTRFSPSYEIERVKLYYVIQRLATGGFGIVSKVRRITDGKILVWKELNYARMNKKERRMMITEVNILRDIEHQHVVQYYDTIIVRELQKIYIVIEYCSRGDIGAMIEACKRKKKRMQETFIWRVLQQILSALGSCHNREEIILHRDLKPANILLDDMEVIKIADFGLAAVVNSQTLAFSKVGTPLYMAPEQIQGSGYTAKSDIWSLGCIIYEMAALKPPFDANNQLELAKCIKEGKFARIPEGYSGDLHRIICWMLQLDQDDRPTVDEILHYMQQRLDSGKSPLSPPRTSSNPALDRLSAALRSGTESDNKNAPFRIIDHPNFNSKTIPEYPPAAIPEEGEDEFNADEWFPGLAIKKTENAYIVQSVDEHSTVGRSAKVAVGDELRALQGMEIAGKSSKQITAWLGQVTNGNKFARVTLQFWKRTAAGIQAINVNLPVDVQAIERTSPEHTPLINGIAGKAVPEMSDKRQNGATGASSSPKPPVVDPSVADALTPRLLDPQIEGNKIRDLIARMQPYSSPKESASTASQNPASNGEQEQRPKSMQAYQSHLNQMRATHDPAYRHVQRGQNPAQGTGSKTIEDMHQRPAATAANPNPANTTAKVPVAAQYSAGGAQSIYSTDSGAKSHRKVETPRRGSLDAEHQSANGANKTMPELETHYDKVGPKGVPAKNAATSPFQNEREMMERFEMLDRALQASRKSNTELQEQLRSQADVMRKKELELEQALEREKALKKMLEDRQRKIEGLQHELVQQERANDQRILNLTMGSVTQETAKVPSTKPVADPFSQFEMGSSRRRERTQQL